MAATRAVALGRRQAAVLFSAGGILRARAGPLRSILSSAGRDAGARAAAEAGNDNAGRLMAQTGFGGSSGGGFGGSPGGGLRAYGDAGSGARGLMASFIPSIGMVRTMCTRGGGAGSAAGAGAENAGGIMAQPGLGGGCGSAAGGLGGRSGGTDAGAVIAGISSSGCCCAKELAELKAENQKLWTFFTNIVDQNGRIVHQLADLRTNHMAEIMAVHQEMRLFSTSVLDHNARVVEELSKLQIQAAANEVKLATTVTKLSYQIIGTGLTAVFALVTFMMPMVKKEWQADTVEEVFHQIEMIENKRKTGTEESPKKSTKTVEVKGASDETESPMKKNKPVLKTGKEHNDGGSDESPKKKWGIF